MGDYHILMQFDIAADRDTVHHALATESGVRAWWSKRTDGPSNCELRVSFPDVPQPFEFTVDRDDDERVEWVTGGFPPWWAGTTIGWFLGRPIVWLMRVETFDAAGHVGMHALESPFPMDVDYGLEPLEGGRATRASIRIRGAARGMYGLLGPFTGMMVKRSVGGDLRRLKAIVESARP